MKTLFALIIAILISTVATGQDGEPWSKDPGNFIVSAGYFPKKSYRALKVSLTFNELIYRFGAYASVESSISDNAFRNVYGVTVTVHRNVFLFAGADLYTRGRGLIYRGLNARKEVGMGYQLPNKLVVMTGWSGSSGFSFQAGLRIPLDYPLSKD